MQLRLRFLLLAVIAFTAMASHALADVPGTPQNLTATWQWSNINEQIWMPVASLKWYGNLDGGMPSGFRIYHADGEKSTYDGFELINSFDRYIWDSTAQDGEWRSILGQQLSAGTHSFYVETYNLDGTSNPGNIATVTMPDSLTFYLSGYPGWTGYPETAIINEPFMYQVGAVNSTSVRVNYSLIAYPGTVLPDGMTIDEYGVINWTPTEKGTYRFIVHADLDGISGLATNVNASIRVLKCDGGAVIAGQVHDQDNNAINGGYVVAIPVSAADTIRYNSESAPIENGTYELHVEEGSYYLYISGGDFDAEYYLDAATLQEAVAVDATCGTTATADVTVNRPTRYTVTGRVADWEDNGINALVTFVGYSLEYPEGTRRQYPEYFSEYASANNDGMYSISLKDGYEYIAYAQLTDTLNYQTGRVIMAVQYFDHVQDYTEAEVITLTGDRTDVNFDFQQLHGFENSLAGQVKTGDNTGIAAYVTAYRVSESNNDQFIVSTTTSSNGEYTFSDLLPGEYVLYAFPTDRSNVAAGYYNENGEAEMSWTNASRVVIGEETNATGIYIVLPEVDTTSGEGMLRGVVYGDNEGMVMGKTDGSTLGSTAITGAYVTLTDAHGVVNSYNLSGNNGAFSLDELTAGTYTLLVDKIGFAPYTTTVIIEGSEPVTVSATLQAETTTGVEETTGNNDARVYPNPATNGATVAFFATPGTASVSVVTVTGMEVLSFRATTVQGLNTVYLNTQPLSTGAYFVRITTSTGVYNLPVRIVR